MTIFEKQVYGVVLTIPFGSTRSYRWVAQKMGRPRAVRAVGNALRKNPLMPFVPCHRVISSDGFLGGYRRGVRAKKILIEREKKIKRALENDSFA